MNGISSNVDLELYEKKMLVEDEMIKFYHESPEKELNSQLMSILMTSSPDRKNLGDQIQEELGDKFSNAVCRFIKREVNNALLRYNKVSIHHYHKSPQASPAKKIKPAGLTDLTFDTILNGVTNF